MISKTKLKELSAYKTAKMCDQEQVFVVEGTKMVQEALSSDFEVETICALEEWFIENKTLVRILLVSIKRCLGKILRLSIAWIV
jgi:tRNA G18 (ribose-2'-O)-methylase SpoU